MSNPETHLTVIVDAVLTDLKSYRGHGDFRQWIVNGDGSSCAVYAQGILRFDKNGKRIMPEARTEAA